MNTEGLDYFIKVYEKKSITGAAKDLYITPQGISKTIKQLEMELETELFYRGPRGMEATETGELLYARAKHIKYLMDDIKKEISIIGGRKRVLNVVINYSATALLPVDYLYQVTEIHPDIKIKIKEYPDEYPIEQLFQEEVDVGLVLGYQDLENFEFELITSGESVAVVSNSHALALKDEISILELEHESLVIKPIENEKEHSFLAKCQENGFTPNVKHEYGSMATAHRLCERNGYVAISIDFVEEEYDHESLKVIRLKEKIPQNVYLVWRKSGINSKVISLLQSYIKRKRKPL
ncbi:LysR family transcriptional regulator [Paenibacillus fonticola]|uniref:LysR family transcriptional regulator n=1 Tax=Paenibacillus fonticola TaxID=379896 RepID=UPI0003665E7D|nr:LysR family transcriptional regulator [Paenibacillus fonticola]